jgi:hypothetical protein
MEELDVDPVECIDMISDALPELAPGVRVAAKSLRRHFNCRSEAMEGEYNPRIEFIAIAHAIIAILAKTVKWVLIFHRATILFL